MAARQGWSTEIDFPSNGTKPHPSNRGSEWYRHTKVQQRSYSDCWFFWTLETFLVANSSNYRYSAERARVSKIIRQEIGIRPSDWWRWLWKHAFWSIWRNFIQCWSRGCSWSRPVCWSCSRSTSLSTTVSIWIIVLSRLSRLLRRSRTERRILFGSHRSLYFRHLLLTPTSRRPSITARPVSRL